MKLRVFASRDCKLGIFNPPFLMQHLGQALRLWEDVCNKPDSAPGKYPADFVLYELGTFDDETGRFYEHGQHVLVCSGLDARRKAEDSVVSSLQ